MSNLLIDDHPLQVLPKLAEKIGLNEALILQQIHYWINPNRNKNYHEERYWVYNTYEQWKEQFPFWCERTIKTIMTKLEKQNLLLTGNFNQKKSDRTKWYTINYSTLEKLDMVARSSGKICTMDRQDLPDVYKETETTTETKNNNINIITKRSGKPKKLNTNNLDILMNDLPSFIPKEMLKNFISHREVMKKPLTEVSFKMLVSKLETLHKSGEDLSACLEESIINNWTGVFPMKRGGASKPSKYKNDGFDDDYYSETNW